MNFQHLPGTQICRMSHSELLVASENRSKFTSVRCDRHTAPYLSVTLRHFVPSTSGVSATTLFTATIASSERFSDMINLLKLWRSGQGPDGHEMADAITG